MKKTTGRGGLPNRPPECPVALPAQDFPSWAIEVNRAYFSQ
jgi:hypothetical protein